MAKLRTIDAIRTSVQSVKKYVDNKMQNELSYTCPPLVYVYDKKPDSYFAEINWAKQSEKFYYAIGTISDLDPAYYNSDDCFGSVTICSTNEGEVTYEFSIIKGEDPHRRPMYGIEIDGLSEEQMNYLVDFVQIFPEGWYPTEGMFDPAIWVKHVKNADGTEAYVKSFKLYGKQASLNGEIIKQELNKKQEKLIYKESIAKSHKLEINGRQGDVLVEGAAPCYIFESIGLVLDRYYTVKIKLSSDIPVPSSLTSEGELAKLYNIPMNIDVNEASLEVDYENNIFIYKLPAILVPKDNTGFDTDIIALSSFGDDFSGLSIDFSIFDKLFVDEYNTPFYSEDKSMFVCYDYFSSLIEYVEIIPEASSEDIVEVEVNNEFLETHRFITEEERKKWNEKQDSVSDAYFIKTLPYISEADDRSLVDDEVDFVRALNDGLYVATQEFLYFSTESNRVDKVDLFHGLDEVYFTIAKHDIIRCVKDNYGETLEYCLVENLNTGIYCMFDVDAGIVALGSINETYLGDVKKIYEYECVEQGVTYTKAEHVTGTMIGGTSYREYQIDEDFVIEKDKKYHVRFVGSNGQVQEFIEEAYYDEELYGNPVYAVYANSISVRTYKSSDGSNVIKVKVYNSLGIPDMDSITINEIAYLSSEFFDKYRFVTQEEKQEWNEKQDKIIYKSNETTIISLRNKVPLDGSLFIFDYPLGLVDGEQYSAKIKFAEGIFELEESALFKFLGLERVTDLNYEIKNNYMIFTNKFVAYSENGAMFLQVGNEETSYFMLVDGVGMNLETGDQYLTNDSSALFCLEGFVKLIDYVEIIGPRQYEISENFFNTHELVSTFAQDDFDEIVGNIFGDQYKSKASFTFVDSDAAPKEYKYPYIEEPYYAKELICNIYHDDGTITATPFMMMGEGVPGGNNYSYVASVSSDNGGVSIMINNVNDKNEWRIVLDYDLSSYFVMPEGISKIEVVVIP